MDTALLNEAWHLSLYGIITVVAFLSVLILVVSLFPLFMARPPNRQTGSNGNAPGHGSRGTSGDAHSAERHRNEAIARATVHHHHNRT